MKSKRKPVFIVNIRTEEKESLNMIEEAKFLISVPNGGSRPAEPFVISLFLGVITFTVTFYDEVMTFLTALK